MGRPISDRQIAKLLGSFGIISGTVRIDGATAKGYHRSAFAEAWNRYPKAKAEPKTGLNVSPAPLGDFQPSQRHNADETGASDAFSTVTETACGGSQKCDLFNNDGHCDVVTVCADVEGEEEWTL